MGQFRLIFGRINFSDLYTDSRWKDKYHQCLFNYADQCSVYFYQYLELESNNDKASDWSSLLLISFAFVPATFAKYVINQEN